MIIQDFINLHMIVKWLHFLNQMICNIGVVCYDEYTHNVHKVYSTTQC